MWDEEMTWSPSLNAAISSSSPAPDTQKLRLVHVMYVAQINTLFKCHVAVEYSHTNPVCMRSTRVPLCPKPSCKHVCVFVSSTVHPELEGMQHSSMVCFEYSSKLIRCSSHHIHAMSTNGCNRVFGIAELVEHILRNLTKVGDDGEFVADYNSLVNMACTSRSIFPVAIQIIWRTMMFKDFYAAALRALGAPTRSYTPQHGTQVCAHGSTRHCWVHISHHSCW